MLQSNCQRGEFLFDTILQAKKKQIEYSNFITMYD